MAANNQEDFSEMDRLLRRTADEVDRAVADRLDIAETLARIKGGGVNEAELQQVLASWSADLLGTVRGTAEVIRAVDAPEFFMAATGRERRATEPWPELRITVSTGSVLAISTYLPDHDADRLRIGVALTVAGRRHVTHLRAEDGAADSAWALVELRGTVEMERDDVSLQGSTIELWVEQR